MFYKRLSTQRQQNLSLYTKRLIAAQNKCMMNLSYKILSITKGQTYLLHKFYDSIYKDILSSLPQRQQERLYYIYYLK